MPRILSQTDNVVEIDFGGSPSLTKKQLARHLDKSERWVEQRAAEGMPTAGWEGNKRLYNRNDCMDWLDGYWRRSANG